MGKVKAVPQFSESISSFCKLMENAQRDYAWNYDEVNRMDRLTQDYLHKLELDGLDYKEQSQGCYTACKVSSSTARVQGYGRNS